MILVNPSFPSFSHTYALLFTDHPPPPSFLALHTSPLFPLHLSSPASMLAHVCANVTSIFHRQPLPVSRSSLLQNNSRTRRLLWQKRRGRTNCLQWKKKTSRYLLLLLHMRPRAHAGRQAMCTYAHNNEHVAKCVLLLIPTLQKCCSGSFPTKLDSVMWRKRCEKLVVGIKAAKVEMPKLW